MDLVSYAQRSTDGQLVTRIDDSVDLEDRNLVHALVLLIVSVINRGGSDTWATIVKRLAASDS